MEALQEIGIAWILALQQFSPALDGVMDFFTFLGKVEFYMVFIPLLYWVVNKSWGFRAFMVLLFTDIVTSSFKVFLHQPRPYWVSEEVRLLTSHETSYGIPSGHSSNPPAVLGYLSVQVRKNWLWVLSVVTVLMISLSRLYLGVHFPHDVLGGWLIGIAALLIVLRVESRVSDWVKVQGLNAQIAIFFVISLLFITLGVLVTAAIASSPDDAQWAQYAVDARSLDHFITLGAAFFGSASGMALMNRFAPFSLDGSAAQKAARYLLGMVGVLLVLYGLDFVFEALTDNLTAGYFLRYVRYTLTTLWVMFGAPWFFLRLKLAAAE